MLQQCDVQGQVKFAFSLKHSCFFKNPPRENSPRKIPTHQIPFGKFTPGKSPQKILTWNIPTHFINCFFLLNMNGGRGVGTCTSFLNEKFCYLQNSLAFSHETLAI